MDYYYLRKLKTPDLADLIEKECEKALKDLKRQDLSTSKFLLDAEYGHANIHVEKSVKDVILRMIEDKGCVTEYD